MWTRSASSALPSRPHREYLRRCAPAALLVFSSLTPHMTGPNLSDTVRKAYILQYAPVGAQVLRGDPRAGAPTERALCEAPDRQFPILRGGRRVA